MMKSLAQKMKINSNVRIARIKKEDVTSTQLMIKEYALTCKTGLQETQIHKTTITKIVT